MVGRKASLSLSMILQSCCFLVIIQLNIACPSFISLKRQDYNFCGHQLVCHFVGSEYRCPDFHNPVDGDEVPVPHFGLAVGQYSALALLFHYMFSMHFLHLHVLYLSDLIHMHMTH